MIEKYQKYADAVFLKYNQQVRQLFGVLNVSFDLE